MKITFELDGRTIDPDKFTLNGGSEMRKLIALKTNVEGKLKGLIDPKTGQPPEILITRKTVSDMTITTSAGPAVAAEMRKRLGAG